MYEACNLYAMVLSFFFFSSGGDGAEKWIQSAELLDDPVSEAPGCQTSVSADAGQSSSPIGSKILCLNHKVMLSSPFSSGGSCRCGSRESAV